MTHAELDEELTAQRCGNCGAFESIDDAGQAPAVAPMVGSIGRCKRHCPQLQFLMATGRGLVGAPPVPLPIAAWPPVVPDDWCCEWFPSSDLVHPCATPGCRNQAAADEDLCDRCLAHEAMAARTGRIGGDP